MMDVAIPYRAMAHNNAWANHRLLAACARLAPNEFAAKRTGFFPSLRATLNHILVIDRFYVDAMEGSTLGPAAWTDRLLLHLFQHQVHHRGQAHAMLSGTSVRPPQLDEFFSVDEAPLRAAEFAALGWTEAAIWNGSGGDD